MNHHTTPNIGKGGFAACIEVELRPIWIQSMQKEKVGTIHHRR